MSDVTDREHRNRANAIRRSMAVYANSEDLINIGAYVKGSSKDIDDAILKHDAIESFLMQATEEKFTLDQAVQTMGTIVNGSV
jgi:flagellum-specific ATP synthase